MLSLYSGTPGSYKSYHAVEEAINWLRAGGNVIANFPINYKSRLHKPIRGIYEYVDIDDLTVDYLVNFAIEHHRKGTTKAQTLVIIDEAGIPFNSRDYNTKVRRDWVKFFSLHRHLNYDIILIAQQDKMIDRQVRAQIELEFKHRSIKHYKMLGKFINFLCGGCYMVLEIWYPCKLANSNTFHIFHKSIANCYDTMRLFVGEKNKLHDKKIQEVKKVETNADDTKEQITKNMSKLVSVLNNFIQRNSKTS